MNNNTKYLISLQVLLAFYSIGGILSKYAAGFPFFSIEFIALYVGLIVILGLYALGWQQVLKHIPLTAAYASRAITIVWGILWGCVFFNEPITANRILGALVIIAGIVLFSLAEYGLPNHNNDISAQNQDTIQ